MQKKNFWSDKLYQNEEIIREFSIGKGYIKFHTILYTIVFIPIFIVSIYLISFLQTYIFISMVSILYLSVMFYYQKYLTLSHQYALTNKRVLIKEGWLDSKVITIDYDTITDIKIYKSFINKIFCKTAMLYINTAGSAEMEGTLKNIETPYEIKKIINYHTNLFKKRMRGLKIDKNDSI